MFRRVVLILALLFIASPVLAVDICDMDGLIAAHKTAVAAGQKRAYPAYVAALQPLAEMGFGPA